MWLPLSDWSELPSVCCVYIVRHRESGKEYVGKTKHLRRRMQEHSKLRSKFLFGRALRKYGLDAFDVMVYATGTDEEMYALEEKVIAERGTYVPGGYNTTTGGDGARGAYWSPEAREKNAARFRGVPLSEARRQQLRELRLANNPFKGRKHTPEAQAKMAEAARRQHTGLKRSEQTRANISASLKGRKAPVLSAEAREKIGAAQRRPNPRKSNPGRANGMYGVRRGEHPAARRVGCGCRSHSRRWYLIR